MGFNSAFKGLIIIHGRLQYLILFFKIPMGTRKNFFEVMTIWTRVLKEFRQPWYSSSLCLCQYSWPCHTEVPNKQTNKQTNKHPPLATSAHPVGPPASSAEFSTCQKPCTAPCTRFWQEHYAFRQPSKAFRVNCVLQKVSDPVDLQTWQMTARLVEWKSVVIKNSAVNTGIPWSFRLCGGEEWSGLTFNLLAPEFYI